MKELVVDEVDVEDVVKRGEKVPDARKYIVRIDKTKCVVEKPVVTGRELLAKVGKTPETDKLYQHVKGHQPEQVQPDQEVDLRTAGVERFTTMPKDTTEGQANLAPGTDTAPRREFRLPAEDEEYLDSLGLVWETVKDGNILYLLIYGWSVPPGYNQQSVDLALIIPGSYSDTEIDMVYFRPYLAKTDGGSIANLADHQIFGENWQRWSRHRTQANPWRVGVDDVSTHLTLVDEWLRREIH